MRHFLQYTWLKESSARSVAATMTVNAQKTGRKHTYGAAWCKKCQGWHVGKVKA